MSARRLAVAQQGTPPRRPSRVPGSGRSGRHGRPDPRDWSDQDPEAGWQSGRAPVAGDAPYPPAEHPYPPSERPYPPADQPFPQEERPFSPDDRPYPPDDRSYPAGRGPRQRGPSRPSRGEREGWRDQDPFADDEGEAPPWAGPSIHATRAGGTRLRPPPEAAAEEIPEAGASPQPRRRGRGRAAAARLRKSRRRVLIFCGTGIVVAVVLASVAAIHLLHKPVHHTSFITSLQRGEFRSVPKACDSVSATLLSQAMSGPSPTTTPVGAGGSTSQCSFTVDHKPVFRVLGVTIEAYNPSAIPAGNGSATDNALATFLVAKAALINPGKKAPLPPAQLEPVKGLGQDAFTALQKIHRAHTATDRVTVMVRERNLIVTISLEAAASGRGYGPVSVPTLQSGALAVAKQVLAKATAEPTVKR
jgi:hypothetical protein